jgi:alpha-aminoadipic semialdehyde synthase
MTNSIGIRREDKNKWERRVPLIPGHVTRIVESGIGVRVQPSPIRVFKDAEFASAGAAVEEDLSNSKVVFAVKEIPSAFFNRGGAYVFFAHVHKGQSYNMPMLRALLEKECTLIDYERIMDASGRRLIFFGRYAGIAGAFETLRALGLRLAWEGIDTPFKSILQPHEYPDLETAMDAVRRAGDGIKRNGLPKELLPLTFGVSGYGNVSLGFQEVIRCLPVADVEPSNLPGVSGADANTVCMTVFKECDMVEPAEAGNAFDLQDYYDHPEKYRPRFHEYVEHLTVLANCIYWEEKYPRLLTTEFVKKLYAGPQPRLRVIGDISADIGGSVEVTVKCTTPDVPNYVYDIETGEAVAGEAGRGPVIMAVDNLPCELPRESSGEFSDALMPFVDAIARADYGDPFDELALPPEIKGAVITHKGALTPDYAYLKEFLE